MKKVITIIAVIIVAMFIWRMNIRTTANEYKDKIILRWITDQNPTRAEQVKEFERLHPDIHVVIDPAAKGKELIQISGGKGPDLLDLNTATFIHYAKNNALYDFSELREKDNSEIVSKNRTVFKDNLERIGTAKTQSDELLSECPELSVESAKSVYLYNQAISRWNEQNKEPLLYMEYPMTEDIFWTGQLPYIVYDKKILAVPANISAAIIIYNKVLFDRYKVSYPKENWTTDDFLDTCSRLTHKVPDSNLYESFAIMPIWVPQCWLYLSGGRFYSDDKKSSVLDSAAGQQALALVGSLYAENKEGVRLAPTASDSMAGSSGTGGGWEEFARGSIGMVNAGRWIYCMTGPLLQAGYTTMPSFPNISSEEKKIYLGGRATGITRDSTHPEAAYKFLKYLVGRDYGRVLLNSGDGVSGVKYYRKENWAMFDSAFPEVQSIMLKQIMDRGDAKLVDLKSLDNSRLAILAAAEWDSMSGAEKTHVQHKVEQMLEMIYNETEKGICDESNPYISKNLFALASKNVEERVKMGKLKPEQWAGELNQVFSMHLRRALNKDENKRSYLIGNIIGICLVLMIVIFGIYKLLTTKREKKISHPSRKGEQLTAICFLLPNLSGFAIFTLIPVILSFAMAFTSFNSLTNELSFVGFNNFVDQMTRPNFWYYLFNTFIFMLGLPISVACSLMLAIVLNNKLRGYIFYRTLFYLPSVVSGIAIFLLWKWIYNSEYGLLNQTLHILGIDNTPNWLNGGSSFAGINFFWAKPALIIMSVWMGMGGPNVLLFLAGLSTISPELYEASEIDGANKWQQFWRIVWPLLSPTTFFIMIMGVIYGLQGGFEMAYAMTEGGPQESTTTLGYHIYNTAFFEFEMGQAAAVAWFLFFLVFGITLLNWKYGEKKVNY